MHSVSGGGDRGVDRVSSPLGIHGLGMETDTKTQPTVASPLYTGLRVLKHKPREITIPGNKSCEEGYSFLSDSPEDKGVGLVRRRADKRRRGWPWRDSMKGVLLKEA